MKLAFLIQCHKNPSQVNTLINMLNHDNIDFYIHVDKKSRIKEDLCSGSNVFVLPDEFRVDVKWATFSQVQATLNLMRYAIYNDAQYVNAK